MNIEFCVTFLYYLEEKLLLIIKYVFHTVPYYES